jgi:nucleotide-binding universal stress UspA family protein
MVSRPYHISYSWEVDLAEKYLQVTKEVFDDMEVEVIVRPPIRGHPADVICKVIEEENFDLVIMGSRGLSTTEKYALGGVTDKVLQHAVCPVLIVR